MFTLFGAILKRALQTTGFRVDLDNRHVIAFIGFGEVGRRFSRDFKTQPSVTIRAFDTALSDETWRSSAEATASAIDVALCPDLRSAVSGAGIVISAVTADQTQVVAEQAARVLVRGQTYVDVNSASPATKAKAADVLGEAGARYIEAAVMAPVLKPGIKVPILAGGPSAWEAAEVLNALGMNVTPVAKEFGKASAIKLSRSIMIKGLEALIVDCAKACGHWDVRREVFGSLAATFPSIDWAALADDMAERVATHGVRRSAEMREAAEMLADMGLHRGLADAVADAQARGARKKPARPIAP